MRKKITVLIISCCLLVLSLTVMCGAAKSNTQIATIEFECSGKVVKYKDDLIPTPNHTIADEVARRKINAELPIKLKTVDKCINAGAQWRQAFLYAFPLLYKTVDKIIKDNSSLPIDSTIKFNPNSNPMFTITREQTGYEVNETRLYQDIYMALRRGVKAKVKVIPQPITPKVSAVDNIKLTNLRSKFSTDFSSSNDNRKHNIALSLSKINGATVLPKQEFSFNKTVGRRSAARGFKEAKIIMNGEYVLGYGGGVCQASTTVYNAAIRADMEVTMVRNHSITPAYVPPSFDAMVNSSSSDLKFINNSEHPIFIRAVANDTTAIVEFYGTQLPYRISTKSVEISRGDVPQDQVIVDVDRKHVDATAASGERVRVAYGHSALKSEGYLVYYDVFGREIQSKLIRSDMYNSCQGIIAVAP